MPISDYIKRAETNAPTVPTRIKQELPSNENKELPPKYDFYPAHQISRFDFSNSKLDDQRHRRERILGSHRMHDAKGENLSLPSIPDNSIILIGNVSEPRSLRAFEPTSEEDTETANTLRAEEATGSIVPYKDARFFDLIPPARLKEITSGLSRPRGVGSPDAPSTPILSVDRMLGILANPQIPRPKLEDLIQQSSLTDLEIASLSEHL